MRQDAQDFVRVATSVLAIMLCAQLARAQDDSVAEPPPAGEFFETVEVDVVNVEVFVTDKKGRPVTGLTADDFEMLEDGEPVPVTHFYAARAVAPSAESPAALGTAPVPEAAAALEPVPMPEDQRLNLVIFIDNQNIRPQTRNRVLKALRGSLYFDLRPDDQVMLASYDGSINVRQGPTHDVDALVAAIDEVAQGAPAGVQASLDRISILRELQEVDLEETAGALSVGGQSMQGTTDWEGLLMSIRTYAQRRYQAIERTMDGMRSFIDTLSGLRGRKALIYVSDGLSLRPGESLFLAWEDKRNAGAGGAGQFNVRAEARELDATPLLEALGRHANANRVTFYTILAGGGQSQTITPAERGAFFSYNAPSNLGQVWSDRLEAIESANYRGSMEVLAEATGGLATLATNDFGRSLDRMRNDFETYYSLGYAPPKPNDGEYHNIKVRMKDPALRVRHRESYRSKTSDEQMTDRTRTALVYDGVGANPLGVVVSFGEERKGEKGRFLIPILVKFPISKLLLVPQERTHEGRVSIYVGARDSHGRTSPIQQMPAPVRIPNDKLVTALGQVAGYRMTLMLRPEEHVVVVGVRDELANVESVARVNHTPGGAANGGS